MNPKIIVAMLVFVLFYNCGTKMPSNSENIIKDRESYVSKLNQQPLETKISEGALTDASGFKDVGKFKLTYYYKSDTKNLVRIENIETTSKVVTENFYFENKDLLAISTKTDDAIAEKLYVYKGNVINNTDLDADYKKVLLDKSRLLRKDFRKITE